jgi:hypothetical protein
MLLGVAPVAPAGVVVVTKTTLRPRTYRTSVGSTVTP